MTGPKTGGRSGSTKKSGPILGVPIISVECHEIFWSVTLLKREPVASIDAPTFLKLIPKMFSLRFGNNSLKRERFDIGKIV